LFLEQFKDFPGKITKIMDEIVFLEEESKIARTALDGSKGEDGVFIEYDFTSTKSNLKSRFAYTETVVNSEGTIQAFLNYNFFWIPSCSISC
jgi:hypothetical protein